MVNLEDKYIFDFVKSLGDYYFIAAFTLDSVNSNATENLLQNLKSYDLIISAQPKEAFNEKEKLVLRSIYYEWWKKFMAYRRCNDR